MHFFADNISSRNSQEHSDSEDYESQTHVNVDTKMLDDLVTGLTNQKFERIQSNSFDTEFLKAVPNLRILPPNINTTALQTTIRDRYVALTFKFVIILVKLQKITTRKLCF